MIWTVSRLCCEFAQGNFPPPFSCCSLQLPTMQLHLKPTVYLLSPAHPGESQRFSDRWRGWFVLLDAIHHQKRQIVDEEPTTDAANDTNHVRARTHHSRRLGGGWPEILEPRIHWILICWVLHHKNTSTHERVSIVWEGHKQTGFQLSSTHSPTIPLYTWSFLAFQIVEWEWKKNPKQKYIGEWRTRTSASTAGRNPVRPGLKHSQGFCLDLGRQNCRPELRRAWA